MDQIKLPTGLRDEVGIVAERKDIVSNWLLKYFRDRCYTRINTPIVEQRNLFNDFTSTNPPYRVFDPAGDDLVLRPDLTLPVARFLSNANIELPRRLYYLGTKFEISPELSGGQNQQTQLGVELIGYDTLKAEMEEVIIMHQLNQHFLHQHQLTIELGHAKLVDQVLDSLDIDHQLHTQMAQALYHKNFPAYNSLLGKIDACDELPFLRKWPRMFGTLDELRQMLLEIKVPKAARPMIDQLVTLAEFASSLPDQQVIIDLSSAVPQKYYTGITFKGYTARSSTYVISGGRYDDLLANFTAKTEPAVGLGINVDALVSIADVELLNQRPVFVYANLDKMQQVTHLIEQRSNYSLALADSLQEAKQQAQAAGATLMVWQAGKGLVEC
ncbi:ATP phosphoribosyltransferase regulatory subunit (plasmid) [Nicoliella spurrieriana]|uniref:ATP phosphoribosyltransferase regulatory subunit n=1 Tax=Nicoliella spurrieriana TaxID=2925830 RepID=A0A976RQB3_9LACO|nr:ATP phosphoribosyltransferase regulatory subunit [Nicoliella spurrieriana]UQS85924.1 ATP phosphoribosyltransferase regulatory subunit [Nicoliella spurrieriana]